MLDLKDMGNFKYESETFTYEPFKGEFIKDVIRNMIYLSRTFNYPIITVFNNRKIIVVPNDTVRSVIDTYHLTI